MSSGIWGTITGRISSNYIEGTFLDGEDLIYLVKENKGLDKENKGLDKDIKERKSEKKR